MPFIPLFNLYQTAHSNLSPFSTSRCPSTTVSIIAIVLYTKPTDEHQYLLRSSCHPLHTKRAFPFSLALRIQRICSSNEMFKLRCNEHKRNLAPSSLTHKRPVFFALSPFSSLFLGQCRDSSYIKARSGQN